MGRYSVGLFYNIGTNSRYGDEIPFPSLWVVALVGSKIRPSRFLKIDSALGLILGYLGNESE